MITYGSVCSGIESASVAWEPLGLSPLWFSEIEPFPSAVLAHHWPQVPNLGDMTKLAHHIRVGAIPAPDILVGGTPCQAFSVAGTRKGLQDDRGQLTIHYGDIANAIDEQREEGDECVIVWENVPGVLSSKDNAFGCFLGLLAGEDVPLKPAGKKWTNAGCVYGPQRTVAWRILDAQYFGVAQRRRRVFVVASARDGFDPTKVLFESQGVRRDIAPSRETREEVAGTLASRAAESRVQPYAFQQRIGRNGRGGMGDLVNALNAESGKTGKGDSAPCVAFVEDPVPPLDASYGRLQGCSGQDLNHGHSHLIAYSSSGVGYWKPGLGPLRAREQDSHENLVLAFAENSRAEVRFEGGDGKITGSLSTGGGKAGQGVPCVIVHGTQDPDTTKELCHPIGCVGGSNVLNGVRRLTPIECERLQGFPDNHVRIVWRNKTPENCPDGPRYKAIGNSKAVPVVRFVGLQVIKEWFRC